MKITNYSFTTNKLDASFKLCVVADLHNREPEPVIRAVERMRPDAICVAGDLTEALDGTMDQSNRNGFAALEALCRIAPVFYAPGNHEIGASHGRMKRIRLPFWGSITSPPKTAQEFCKVAQAFWKTPLQSGRAC